MYFNEWMLNNLNDSFVLINLSTLYTHYNGFKFTSILLEAHTEFVIQYWQSAAIEPITTYDVLYMDVYIKIQAYCV